MGDVIKDPPNSSGDNPKHANRPHQEDASGTKPIRKKTPAKTVVNRKPSLATNAVPLSFMGALTAQRALRKFLTPHRRLLDILSRRSIGKLSLTPLSLYRVAIPVAPTFQLEPKEIFQPERLQNFAQEIVHDTVQRLMSHSSPGTLAKALCNEVRAAIQGMGPKRYKYVVFCVVADNDKQSMLVASRCLWNTNFDDYFSVECLEEEFVVSLTVFASYMD
ncbi:hypothetical protein SprV_0802584300 [Sparganum proliferum]